MKRKTRNTTGVLSLVQIRRPSLSKDDEDIPRAAFPRRSGVGVAASIARYAQQALRVAVCDPLFVDGAHR